MKQQEKLQEIVRYLQQDEAALEQVYRNIHEQQDETSKLYILISEILIQLGVKSNLCGYDYLREAIQMCYYKNAKCVFCKEVYEKIAQEKGLKPCAVDRAIRYAIATSFNRSNKSLLKTIYPYIFSNQGETITNSQYIMRIVDYIKMQEKQ